MQPCTHYRFHAWTHRRRHRLLAFLNSFLCSLRSASPVLYITTGKQAKSSATTTRIVFFSWRLVIQSAVALQEHGELKSRHCSDQYDPHATLGPLDDVWSHWRMLSGRAAHVGSPWLVVCLVGSIMSQHPWHFTDIVLFISHDSTYKMENDKNLSILYIFSSL